MNPKKPTSLQQQLKALLNDKEFIQRIEVLDKQITEKERLRDRLEQDISSVKDRVETAEQDFEDKLEKLNISLRTKAEELGLVQSTKENLDADIKTAKAKLKEVRDEVASQTKYLSEQQVKIDEIINKWNDQLREFREADNEVKVKRDSINRDIIRLEQDKANLEEDTKLVESKNVELNEQYKIKADGYKANLAEAKSEIHTAQQELLELELKNKARLEAVETREQAITIRERKVEQDELNLSSREKKLNMKLGLSRVSIE